MEQRTKRRICLLTAGLALFSLIGALVLSFVFGLDDPTVGIMIVVLLLLWLGAMVASISFSKDGWTVKGSTPEWIVAAFLDPILAYVLYSASKSEGTVRGNPEISEDDRERLDRL